MTVHAFLVATEGKLPSIKYLQDVAMLSNMVMFDPDVAIETWRKRQDAVSTYVRNNPEWDQLRPLVYDVLRDYVRGRRKGMGGGFLVRGLPRCCREADWLCEVFGPGDLAIVVQLGQATPDEGMRHLMESGGAYAVYDPGADATPAEFARFLSSDVKFVSFENYRRKFDNSFMHMPTPPYSQRQAITNFCTPATACDGARIVQLSLDWADSSRQWRQFCGSHPVSLTRESLSGQLAPNAARYVVSAKLDGTRYFLLVCNGSMWFVDRNTHVWCGPKNKRALRNFEGFMGDVELCDGDANGGVPVLFFIDLVAINCRSVRNQYLQTRLDLMNNFVKMLVPLKAHFTVRMQTYHSFGPSGGWAGQATIEQLGKAWRSHDPSASPFDGLVFTPSQGFYALGRSFSLLKWKPPEKNTVDLQINTTSGSFETRVYYSVDEGLEDAGVLVGMPTADEEPELHEIDSPIVECCAEKIVMPLGGDKDAGKPCEFVWRYIRIRRDKNEPNVHWVVNRIVDSISENITHEDILRVLPKPVTFHPQREHRAGDSVAPPRRPRRHHNHNRR